MGGIRMKKDFAPFDERIWLSSPTMHGPELEYMKKAFDTNWMSTVGENIDMIEKQVCEITGRRYGVALSSGTSALHMAVKLAGVKRGERVFCTDMTFSATVNPVVYEGGIPVFIDTEYDTWNMDPKALERAFSVYPDVRVVVLAHLYGTPAKTDEIKRICRNHGALLIEDAAESFGALYKGAQTGSLGDISVISFNGNKIITGSSGGILLTDSEKEAEKVRKWSAQSRENAPWYQHEEIGYNYRMSNVIAGVVRGQLPYLQEHIDGKKAIYERYAEGFRDLPVRMNPFEGKYSQPNYWLSCMIIEEEAMSLQDRGDRTAGFAVSSGKSCPAEILEALLNSNAEGRPVWKPMHMQPVFAEDSFITSSDGRDAGADIFRRGLCLPSDNKMTEEQQDKVIEIVKSCFL